MCRRVTVGLAWGLVAVTGCDTSVAPPPPLTLTVSVDQAERAVGQEFTFTFEAEGGTLLELLLTYGDGASETVSLHGARTASGVRSHTYSESGIFQVVGEVTDLSQGTRTAEVEVTVLEGPGGSG